MATTSSSLFRRSALDHHFGGRIERDVLRIPDVSLHGLFAPLFTAWRRHQLPFVPQVEMAECGAACLAMVMAHHGHWAPLPEVREACGVSRGGTSAKDLVETARAYGFDAEGVRVEIDDLEDLPLPAILHWGFSHFVVLERCGGPSDVSVIDPNAGALEVGWEELDRSFTGVALLLSPGEGFRPRPAGRSGLRRYLRTGREHKADLGRVLVASLAFQAFAAAVPLCVQMTIDRAVVAGRPDTFSLFLFAAGVLTAGATAIAWLRNRALHCLRVALDRSLMTSFVDRLLHLPVGFFLRRHPGDLAHRVRSTSMLRDLLTSRSISSLFDGLLVLVYLGVMFHYSQRLTLIVGAALALRLLAALRLREGRQRILGSELTATGQESAVLVEGFGGIEGLRASGGEPRLLRRWAKAATQRINARVARRWLAIASEKTRILVRGAVLAAILWWGGREVLSGRLTVGGLAALLALETACIAPLESLLESLEHFQSLRSHVARIDDVLEVEPELSSGRDPGQLRGEIALENVRFGYASGSSYQVRDISVTIRPGQKIAIVGRSGAGKSTLARLLLGLIRPAGGVVRFDGNDLRELDLSRVRRQVGAVLQESFLFDGTLRENLTLGAAGVSEEEIARATELAACSDWIAELPSGLETSVGEDGSRLSGGQRQCVCLARVLLQRPTILLLDEATSNVDRARERRINRCLARLSCTRIVITHRLETIEDADRILVLAAGRVVQDGTYMDLAVRPGTFRDTLSSGSRHGSSG